MVIQTSFAPGGELYDKRRKVPYLPRGSATLEGPEHPVPAVHVPPRAPDLGTSGVAWVRRWEVTETTEVYLLKVMSQVDSLVLTRLKSRWRLLTPEDVRPDRRPLLENRSL